MSDWLSNDGPEDYCFGCGQRNESGLRLRYRRTGDASVESEYRVPGHFRGQQGVVHGGIQATLLDEVMGLALHASLSAESHKIVTASLEVRYRRPAPIETPLLIRAHVARTEGSNVFLEAEILDPEGQVLTEGQARWRRLD